MARSLDQVMKELDPYYSSSRKTTNSRIEALPGQFQSELEGLNAQQSQAFGDITDAARRRGLGFSGIPVGEQAQYNATQFMPAVARLKGTQHETQLSLQEALSQLGRDQRGQAQSIYDSEQARALQRQQQEEAQRQFNENLGFQREQLRQQRELAEMQSAAAAGGGSAGIGAYLNDLPKPEARFVGSDDFRGRLAWESQKGNNDAKIALKYAGNDGRYDGNVSNLDELAALKRIGIQGNYSMPGLNILSSGGGGW